MSADETAKERVHGALEPLVQHAFVYPDGDALTASIAISLKRIADVAEQFGDHPDNCNAYGETGMRALMGELGRFKSEVVNDISSMLHRRG